MYHLFPVPLVPLDSHAPRWTHSCALLLLLTTPPLRLGFWRLQNPLWCCIFPLFFWTISQQKNLDVSVQGVVTTHLGMLHNGSFFFARKKKLNTPPLARSARLAVNAPTLRLLAVFAQWASTHSGASCHVRVLRDMCVKSPLPQVCHATSAPSVAIRPNPLSRASVASIRMEPHVSTVQSDHKSSCRLVFIDSVVRCSGFFCPGRDSPRLCPNGTFTDRPSQSCFQCPGSTFMQLSCFFSHILFQPALFAKRQIWCRWPVRLDLIPSPIPPLAHLVVSLLSVICVSFFLWYDLCPQPLSPVPTLF